MWRQSSILLVLLCTQQLYGMQTSWSHWGGDVQNRRFADISCLDGANLKTGMKVKWIAQTAGTTFAPPSVCSGFLYTVDQAGFVYKFNAGSGTPVWKFDLSSLNVPRTMGFTTLISRTTPILSSDCRFIYVGLQRTAGGYIVALETEAGKLAYAKKVDDQPLSKITTSGIFHKGSLYLGTASFTEATVADPVFRGSMLKIDAATGAVKWQSFLCPPGYSGCAVWGSSPVIDEARNQVCVGTGNNYKVPATALQCRKAAGANLLASAKCVIKDNYVDALVCLDLATGRVNWGRTMNGLDIWMPQDRTLGMDWDFAQAPILVKLAGGKNLLIGASKAGRAVAVDPGTGKIAWGPTPGEPRAFAMFGSCSNGPTYCFGLFWFTAKQGGVVCVNSGTGARKWRWFDATEEGPIGPLTCTQTAVFVPRMDQAGSMVAFDINNGKILGTFTTGKTLFGGPTIVNGVAYFGSGYSGNGGVNDNRLFAVSLPLKGTC